MASPAASPGVRQTAPANVVKGRVEIRGTRTGLTGLVVQVIDIFQPPGAPVETRKSLGSSGLENGFFEVRFDDSAFQHYRSDGSRPALLVSIHAPEGANGRPNSEIFESTVRQHAAREECFLIHIDASEIRSRGLLLPAVPRDAAG